MTGLFWYKILFMTELLIAESVFFFRLEKRSFFGWRVFASYVICYAAAIIFPLENEFSYTAWYVSLMFLILSVISLLCFFAVFKIKFINAFFFVITAYTAQQLSYELASLVFSLFGVALDKNAYGSQTVDFTVSGGGTFWFVLGYIDIFVLVYSLIYIVLARKMEKGSELKIKSYSLMLLSGLILLVDIILNASVIYLEEGYSPTYETVNGIYNIISCILVFYIQINLVSITDMRTETAQMKEMLRQSQRQYMLQKETINLINTKCHDLRHRMSSLAQHGTVGNEELREISDAILIYDAKVNTGNEALDVILTEKSLICREKGIKMTCLADGSGLGFIREGDLYALFGNIADNAIEAASSLEDAEKRCISLNVGTSGAFVSVSENNYYKGSIKFADDGLPVTEKDTDYHGYGMLSIATVVKKYEGDLSVSVKGDMFRLNVLIPVPREYVVKENKPRE